MPDSNLEEALNKVRVFASLSPSQKLKLVNTLPKQGQIIAVTGDRVNDTLALKSAHIGGHTGKSRTDVAMEASEVVTTDDNSATIVGGAIPILPYLFPPSFDTMFGPTGVVVAPVSVTGVCLGKLSRRDIILSTLEMALFCIAVAGVICLTRSLIVPWQG
jgi:predicted membrane protein (TIGR00267 family)